MSSSVSIVIPTYNRMPWLGPTLDSVFGLAVPPGVQVEVLVIDNNCTDGTAALVDEKAKISPWPLRHIVETQQGLCFGRNRGLKEASGEHVIFLDDDIAISPHWLQGYIDAVNTLGADCVVGPVTPVFDGPVPSFMTPRVVDSIGSYYSRKGTERQVLPPERMHQIPGCNFGVGRTMALELGGFNTRLGRVGKALLAGEDSEFGMRLARAGKCMVYEPRCAIDHLLVSEKMTKRYMRRRWMGLGATKRAIAACGSFSRTKHLGRICLKLLASCVLRARGYEALGFQRELEALRLWGYWRAAPLPRSSETRRGEAFDMTTSSSSACSTAG